MLKFDANLSMMFPELEVPQRFEAARKAGFTACEFLRPYAYPIADMKAWLSDAGMQIVLINSPSGSAEAGERGLAALPGRTDDFKRIFEQSLSYATGLGAGMIHVLAGVVPEGADAAAYESQFIENLRWAADLARPEGVTLNLEPLNHRDVPRYVHSKTVDTRRIIEATGKDNVRLQYDLYHLQITQGDLVARLREELDLVSHIQFSSVPGRFEPQHGEVAHQVVFDAIEAMGYDGWMGCEYNPKAGTLDGLRVWGARYGLG